MIPTEQLEPHRYILLGFFTSATPAKCGLFGALENDLTRYSAQIHHHDSYDTMILFMIDDGLMLQSIDTTIEHPLLIL